MEATTLIHPSADVSADVRLGDRTRIWDQVRVREGAEIGSDCIVGRGAYIDSGVRIGDRVKIQNNALVYHGVTVSEGVFIGPAAILTNDRFPRSITVDGAVATSEDWTVSEIHLAEGCSIGAGAVVVAGCRIGTFATVGAGAVVTRDVPGHALVAGNPARQLGWVCRCGQRLEDINGTTVVETFEGSAVCPADGTTFRVSESRCEEGVA